jgi:hypothetical protein
MILHLPVGKAKEHERRLVVDVPVSGGMSQSGQYVAAGDDGV